MIVLVVRIRNQYFIVPSVLECVWQGCFSEKENSLFFMFWLCFVALSVKYWFVLKCNHCSISIVLSSVWVHKYCFPQLNVSQLTFHGVFFMFMVQKRWKTYLWLVLLLFFLFFSFFWPSSTQHSALEGCVKLHSWQKVKYVIPLHSMWVFLSSFTEITLKLLFPVLFQSKHNTP